MICDNCGYDKFFEDTKEHKDNGSTLTVLECQECGHRHY